jgi:hypothetical protein
MHGDDTRINVMVLRVYSIPLVLLIDSGLRLTASYHNHG